MNDVRQALGQVRLEQRAFWRNPQSAFFTFALPVGLLLIFGAISSGETIPGRPDIDGLTLFVPGILAFGIVVAAYGTLAGTIAELRAQGVLKRLRATPLRPGAYLAGHLGSVLTSSIVIAVTTVALGRLVFGVSPRPGGLLPLLASMSLGVLCLAALGLAISGFIPSADAAGPITNGTYIPLAIVSGTFSSHLVLPTWLDPVVRALPIRALTDGLRAGYDPAVHTWPVGELAVLAAWAAIGVLLARRYFRWSPS